MLPLLERVGLKMANFERSRYIMDFHLAGFAYQDGLDVIDELSLGKPVQLVLEPDNPYDANAIAIFYKGHKLGYMPKAKNELLSTLLYFGYEELFEARIQAVNLEQHPERQFRIVIKVRDNRKTAAKSQWV